MKQELEDILYEKYPALFAQKDLPDTESCMSLDIECGDGWYTIIDVLCMRIQSHINFARDPQAEFFQIKEKFGGLRIYMDNESTYISALIDMAVSISYNTCEVCGTTVNAKPRGLGWIKTLCEDCNGSK